MSLFYAPICSESTARTGLFSETHFSYSVMKAHFQEVQIISWEATHEATGNYILPEHFVCNATPAL